MQKTIKYPIQEVDLKAIPRNRVLSMSITQTQKVLCEKTISQYGLLTPIVLMENTSGEMMLLTGENELPAYQPTLMDEAVFYDRQVFHERFSITDKGLPSRTSMITILDAIDQSLASGHKLYLHCWGGIGRTGTTVGCFLVRHGLSGQAALHKLASLYRTAAQSKLYPNSPETREQIDFILNWHES